MKRRVSDDELKTASAIGNEASAILENKLVSDAICEIAEDIVSRWKRSDPAEKEERETLYFEYRAAEDFANKLVKHVTRGLAADVELAKREDARKDIKLV